MEITEANLQQMAGYLQQTLSVDANVRRQAEKLLESIETQRNFPLILLHLMDKQEVDMVTRTASSIAFKNYIKRNWVAHEDDNSPDKIHPDDRISIKGLIVTLMLRSPLVVQKQLSDAVSIIGKHDFPKKWPQLIDEMVEKFATGDFNVINGVLRTAHSIFKRYRFEFKSQELWEEIKLVLDRTAKPLTDLLQATMQLSEQHKNNKEALSVIYSSLLLMCKVFYSLNIQDLPEFFEDNMAAWMNAFHMLLTTDVPCLHSDSDDAPGILEQLRSQICENISLYAHKYDEEFSSFTETFVNAVWNLLIKTGLETKYDSFVSHAMHFLSLVADRNQYSNIFENPGVLASICEKVIIPNLDFRESDNELFEDSPEEYIRRDIEGSDIDTRRRGACDLVKSLSRKFEEKIFAIFGQYLEILLAKYKENPQVYWRAKDTAIYLVGALTTRGGTQKHGVTQASQLMPLPEFCSQHIIPELEHPNVNELPVLRASTIKFFMTFRSLLGQETVLKTVPHMIRFLSAQSVVVHSYAACTLDKYLIMRDSNNALVVNAQFLSAYTSEIISALFGTLSITGSNENEYVMKTIMRTFSTLQEATMPYMAVALPRLTEILGIVSKNPSKPHFNHYLFETLSLAIKIVCKQEISAVSNFEEALFPVFQGILQQDILEFMPYVFQMLSLLLEIREGTSSIPEPYWALFPCLLAPTLWDRPGNVTPLIRLLTAFIKQSAPQIAALGKLNGVLGVFQKMIASKANDHEGFYLLQSLLTYYSLADLQPSLRQIFSLLFQRLSLSKTAKYVRGLIVFFCFYSAKVGAQSLIDIVDQIQNNMFGLVIERVFLTDMAKVTTDMDRKIVAVGLTKLLAESPAMLTQPYVQYWSRLLEALIELFEMPPDTTVNDDEHFIEIEETPGYQAAFSQLNFAQPKKQDFLENVTDVSKYLAESLVKLGQSRPGEVPTLIGVLSHSHSHALQRYCDKAGVHF